MLPPTQQNLVVILAPESDQNDSEVVKHLSSKLVDYYNLDVTIRTMDRQHINNVSKKYKKQSSSKDAFETVVEFHLKEASCIIFVIDRDGTQQEALRIEQKQSLINRINRIKEKFEERVYLIQAINEIEAWLLIDCIGIFCYFARGHYSLPKECKQNSNRAECLEPCRRKIVDNNKFNALIKKYQKGDTQTIEEPVAGGKGVKEYTQRFAKEIFRELHKGEKRSPKDKRYKEKDSPEIAKGYIEINADTLRRNNSLQNLGEVLEQCCYSKQQTKPAV